LVRSNCFRGNPAKALKSILKDGGATEGDFGDLGDFSRDMVWTSTKLVPIRKSLSGKTASSRWSTELLVCMTSLKSGNQLNFRNSNNTITPAIFDIGPWFATNRNLQASTFSAPTNTKPRVETPLCWAWRETRRSPTAFYNRGPGRFVESRAITWIPASISPSLGSVITK